MAEGRQQSELAAGRTEPKRDGVTEVVRRRAARLGDDLSSSATIASSRSSGLRRDFSRKASAAYALVLKRSCATEVRSRGWSP
jgi:hypothetical protein